MKCEGVRSEGVRSEGVGVIHVFFVIDTEAREL